MFIVSNSVCANFSKESAPEDTLNSSAGMWHPKMFYVIYPDFSLRFILPHEPEQSGVYNLFFISKESGETLLLDTIKDNKRCVTQFSLKSIYDVILLYNNGKYVRHNDVLFEDSAEVDMRNLNIQPLDSVSKLWKTMRSFDCAITDRESDRDDMTVSDFIIKGYALSLMEGSPWNPSWEWRPTVGARGTNAITKRCAYDGYFEIDVEDDTEQTFRARATLHYNEEFKITSCCGVFLVMRGVGAARKDPQ